MHSRMLKARFLPGQKLEINDKKKIIKETEEEIEQKMRRALTQKPVCIMKSSIEAPQRAETAAIFRYQSKNFMASTPEEEFLSFVGG